MTQAANAVSVVDGRLTVQIDFGRGAFNGRARWLQIAVRSRAGAADCAFIARDRLPPRGQRGFVTVVPDLVVETVSPD